MKKTLLYASALPVILAFAAPAFADEIPVVASFTVLADVAKQVGGDHVTVKSLVGPNGDPHEFEPSPADAKALKSAKVVFVSGEGLEGWMDRLITASGYQGKPVTVSQGVKTRKMEEDGQTVTDPHVWNSPVNVKVWVKNIETALIKADPADAEAYKANARAYLDKLDAMDAYAHSRIDPIPESARKVLTSHDAFGYFGREYKVRFLAPIGVSTETEASAGDVARLINPIKAEHVKTYFFENSNDPRLVKQIAKATGASAGGELYVESLSDKDGVAPTYETMFRYNVDLIAAAMAKGS
ncbi:zinc/manganese transport system substrate-binding protein [Rhizobium sp. SG_E_25_P2]|uniref:metal ABC transporter substrate-binding protein n=1 Tax=Rhizobium sp. SG_E_25_P2 TaxID=2879942 RepID=UPI0024743F09|nr:metal ABC transporter substrate-binding protein [Rhizobium sp. SG_E_25_P2]MDH6268508.1 zinc/manganese transport system substrate-binding protein [Rhizobium sp. SG_E_25_P2]